MRGLMLGMLATLGAILALGCGDGTPDPDSPEARPAEKGLLGNWVARTVHGELRLEILSDTKLVFAGDPATYLRVGDTLKVVADGEQLNYGIALAGDRLDVTFQDGSQVAFQRESTSARDSEVASAAGATEGLDHPRHLSGTLMNFGSATGVRSSYARTTRVTFDGQGGFVVRNETQFSSDAGGHYANPVTDRGRYRIAGSQVILNFASGEKGTAQIKVRQTSGRITELIHNGDLYGPEP